MGSIPECRLLARNAQKLTGRYWHHKENGGKLPSLKEICHSGTDSFAVVPKDQAISSSNPNLGRLKHAKTNLRNRRVSIIGESCKDNCSEVEMNKAELVA
jgi:hypothetical protein